jgi:hypothetical protein
MLKGNDILDPEYDDEEAQKEINQDALVVPAATQYNDNYAMEVDKAAAAGAASNTPPNTGKPK